MSLKTLMASGSSFAHLLGRPVTAKRAQGEDEDPPRKRGESDEDYEKRRAEAEDEDRKKDGESDTDHEARVASNRAKRALEPDDSGDDSQEGDLDEGEHGAAPENTIGDSASDSADMRTKAISSARRRERARCAAIFRDSNAATNPVLAAELAFNTDLPRRQAIASLRAGSIAVELAKQTTATGPKRTLDQRMASVPVPPLAAGDGAPQGAGGATGNKAYDAATQVILAGMKRRGEDTPEAVQAFLATRAKAA